MLNLPAIIIASLATYRLTAAIVREDGPAHIFLWLRGRIDPDRKTWIGEGYNCVFCVSFWLALGAALFVSLLGYADAWAWPLTWLGIAGAVALLFRWEGKR
jgi:hypothetical protein